LYDLNQTRKDIVGPLSECAIVNSSLELTTGLVGEVSAVSCAFCYGADGCLGLISSALTGYTGYPSVCFLLSDENYRGEHDAPFIANNSMVIAGIVSDWVKGSARAPGWFDFYDFVNYFNSRFPGSIRFGGHGQAGSFSVLTDYVSAFSRELLQFAIQVYKLIPPDNIVPPYDFSVFMGDASKAGDERIVLGSEHFDDWVDFSDNLDSLKPFGEGFVRPSFRVVVDVSSRDLAIQYLSGGRHLKCSFGNYDLILWNCGEMFSIDKPFKFYADVTLGINEFRGKKTVTFYGSSYSKVTQEVENIFDIHVNVSGDGLHFGIL
jgi:single-stranded DNA-specific DHH superfamily exonuclease